MFGRVVGLLFGLAIAATGLGLYKPALAARYEHVVDFARLPLGPFDAYRSVISLLIIAFGLVVAVASLQRETARKPIRQGVTVLSDAEELSHSGPEHTDAPVEAAPVTHEAHEEPAEAHS